MRVPQPVLLTTLLLAGTACQRDTQSGTPPSPEAARAKSAESAAPPPAASQIADPGPQFSRRTGKIAHVDAPPIEVTAAAKAIGERAAYVEVELPGELDAIKIGRGFTAPRLVVEGDRYGLAVPMEQGIRRDRPLFRVRFAGPQPPPERFSVVWNEAADRRGKPGIRQVFAVTGVGAAETRPELTKEYYDTAGRWFGRRGRLGGARSEPFYVFAEHRVAAQGAIAEQRRAAGARRAVRAELADAMAFYTGLTSIEEALQADRGLRNTVSDKLDEVLLETVEPVELPGHPWKEMIAKLPGNPAPQIEPLAAAVPNDVLYLHFHDLRSLVRLAKDVSALVTPLARVLEERPGERRFVQRYEMQLAVERMGLSEKLGHLAAKGVALVASDPFFREGTEIAVLFDVNNRGLLDTALASYEARIKEKRADAAVSTFDLDGVPVRRFGTADEVVNQHRAKLGNVLVLANSKWLLRRIIAVHANKAAPLAGSGEYQYFRSIYPYDKAAEDGFIFIGDEFVRRVIGPRTKIMQSRRMHAQADLQSVGYANLLYGWLEGKPARSVDDLLESGLLRKTELKHHLGGYTISFDPVSGARSAWGTATMMKPLAAIDVSAVSIRERDAYRRFKQTYQSYWRGFIDPIGIRVKRDDDGKTLTLDGQMLPLIGRSDYREVEELVGDTRIEPGDWQDGIRFLFAVDEKARLRQELEGLGRSATGNRDLKLSWLGGWVMAGVADHSGLWDAALVFGDVPQAGDLPADRKQRTRDAIKRFPIYVGAEVNDKLALAATLTALKTVVETVAPGMVKWGSAGSHNGVEIVKVTEQIDGPDGGALHYAIVNDVIVMALDLGVLQSLIDTIKAGRKPKTTTGSLGPQAELEVTPLKPDGWLNKTLVGMVERGNLNTQASARLAYEAIAIGRGWPKDEAEADALALAYLGYVPKSPSGGDFSMGPNGLVQHSIYGSELAPTWPALPIPGSAAAEFVEALKTLELRMAFEGEGASRGLHTWARWAR